MASGPGISKIEAAKQKLMTAEEYATLSHEVPYLLELQKGSKRLTYFGSAHTHDPAEPMLIDIEKKYRSTDPDMVFVEGFVKLKDHRDRYGQWALSHTREDAVHIGESAFTLWLALRDGRSVASPEPDLKEEIAYLESGGFTREEIFVFYVARHLEQYQRSSHKSLPAEEYIRAELALLSGSTTWKDFPFTFDHFRLLYTTMFGPVFEISTAPLKTITDPIPWPHVPEETRINQVARESSRFRDLCIIEEIGKALERHDNLFVVFGASHAVMQEPALRALLTAP